MAYPRKAWRRWLVFCRAGVEMEKAAQAYNLRRSFADRVTDPLSSVLAIAGSRAQQRHHSRACDLMRGWT